MALLVLNCNSIINKRILAFILAPWPLFVFYSIMGLTLGIKGMIFAIVFVAIMSYPNLLLFGIPLYLILKKRNLLNAKIILLASFTLGFIEGLFIGGSEAPFFSLANFILSVFLGLNSMVVGYTLLRMLPKEKTKPPTTCYG
jgi:hypothetical protein